MSYLFLSSARKVFLLFFPKLITFVISFILVASITTPSEADNIEVITPDKISPEIMQKIKDALSGFQKPLPQDTYRGIRKPPIEETQIKSIYPDLNANIAQEPTMKKKVSDAPSLWYFFSFSMPKSSIESAIRDAVKINEKGDRHVTLVLRGFVDNNFYETIKKFYGLIKDMKIQGDLPVEVNPELFAEHDVREVPLIVTKDGKGRFLGDVSIPYVISRFDEELKNYGRYGNSYTVQEEDFLKFIASKQGEIEEKLKERLTDIRKNMLVLKRYDGKFTRAKEDRAYYIDPSFILEEDIKDHTGKILFKKGSKFYPSDYISLGKYIIIDGNDQEQVTFALKGNYRKIILISGDLEKLAKHKKRFYFANDLIIKRLNVQKVPLIVEQEGKLIRVTEKAL